ncbi:MAG: DUF4012 domain-containing protein [Candidatus Moraniibacteriota bacterium]|nr:MAG: DUF4012 domain-containing protein [Candidatus Moranbacteria bacterium]
MFSHPRVVAITVLLLSFLVLGFFGVRVVRSGFVFQGKVLGAATDGYGELSRAIEDVKLRDFSASGQSFQNAFASFSEASSLFGQWNETLIEGTRFLPVLSKISSGKNLVEAARDIAAAGESMTRVGKTISSLDNPLDASHRSFLDVFRSIEGDLRTTEELLSRALSSIEKVSVNDLPEDKRETFLRLKNRLPEAVAGMRVFVDHSEVFSDMLGGNGPRSFLFLFQNNHEMRATGGFIGSYAFLDMANGRVRKFFVDGIFNPDGQIHEDIVPPMPLQKVSAGWSLHDSNWFPDFPTSAEKAIHFYEKTGGPTVDGVVSCTPEVLRRFLEITGPIRMEKYGVTIDDKNFLALIQHQVEVAYDKKENKPKEILADLAPILVERIFGKEADIATKARAFSAIEAGLAEKHILFYSRNRDIERLISKAGWSGEVLPAKKDYLSVIHTNINGYKTDGVIDERIRHVSQIQDDGSVIDTVTVHRTHRGGKTGFEWWDRVNADYLRVYVPLGSTLLSAEGYTRETVEAPLDYDRLRFSRDPDVERENAVTKIDPASGTRISEDAGKSVFGNWVYVSPGESVEVTYRYRLPFRVECGTDRVCGSYSIIFQKQAGSVGSELLSELRFPKRLRVVWQSEKNLIPFDGGLRFETKLTHDRYSGVVFGERDL